MARLVAGGTPDAVATAATEETRVPSSNTAVRYSLVVPRQQCLVYQTRTGATRLTDLQLDADGTAVASIVADDNGQLPAFRLPDGLRVDGVWLDPVDAASDRFFVPVRLGPASADAAYAPLTDLAPTVTTAATLMQSKIVPVDASGAAVTMTALPALSTVSFGAQFGVSKSDSTDNTVTVPFAAGDTTSSGATSVLLTMVGTLELQAMSNPAGGKVWRVVNHTRSDSTLDGRFGAAAIGSIATAAVNTAVAGLSLVKTTDPGAPVVRDFGAGILARIDAADGTPTFMQANDVDGGPTPWAIVLLAAALNTSIASAITLLTRLTNTLSYPGVAVSLPAADGTATFLDARDSDGSPTDWAAALIASRTAPLTGAANAYALDITSSDLYATSVVTGTRKRLTTTGDVVAGTEFIAPDGWAEWSNGTRRMAARCDGTTGQVPNTAKVTNIAWWSDSMGVGVQQSAVATATGKTIADGAAGGDTSTEITLRAGSTVPILAAFTMPTSGDVVVTATFPTAALSTSNPGRTDNVVGTGTIAGIACSLKRTIASGVWTVTRTGSGSATAIPAGTPFLKDPTLILADQISLLWAGRNQPDQFDVFVRDVNAWVANLRARCRAPKFLLIGPTTSTSEYRTTAGYGQIHRMIDWLLLTYPDNTVDMNAHLLANGLALTGTTATSQDTADIAGGTPPTSLHVSGDTIHWSDTTKQLAITPRIASFLTAKGW